MIRNLIDSASKGGNFVLNVGPNAEGELPPEHVALLEEVGRWTRANGEAIYGTVPAPEIEFALPKDVFAYATRAKDRSAYYVHVLTTRGRGASVTLRMGKAEMTQENLPAITALDTTLGAGGVRFGPTNFSVEAADDEIVVSSPSKVEGEGWFKIEMRRADPVVTVFKVTPRGSR